MTLPMRHPNRPDPIEKFPAKPAVMEHDDGPQRTMQMLVWYVVTPGAIAGTAVILWATWQVIRWIAS